MKHPGSVGLMLIVPGGKVKSFSPGETILPGLWLSICILLIQYHRKKRGSHMMCNTIVSQALPLEHVPVVVSTVVSNDPGQAVGHTALVVNQFSSAANIAQDLFCQQCKVVAILSGVVEMSFQTLTQSDWDQETAFAWRLGLRVVEGVPSKNHKQQVPLLHSTISMQSNMKVMASLPRMITMIILTTSKMLF